MRFCCRHILDNCRPDLEFINGMIDKGAIARLEQVSSCRAACWDGKTPHSGASTPVRMGCTCPPGGGVAALLQARRSGGRATCGG